MTRNPGFPRLPEDAFGDPYELADLPLPRPAVGYAVQALDSDCLLDRRDGAFQPVRTAGLEPVFATFAEAHAAACAWLAQHPEAQEEHPLAIVPVGFDPLLQRPVLIYGVLPGRP